MKKKFLSKEYSKMIFSIFLMFSFVLSSTNGLLLDRASAVAQPNGVDKIDICHATAAHANPYNLINISKSAIINGHDIHDGEVYPNEPWGDIIPPFDYNAECPNPSTYTEDYCEIDNTCKTGEKCGPPIIPAGQYLGKNWNDEGQAIHKNECEIVSDNGDSDVTIIAYKVICEDESYLPNMSGGLNIDANTAQNWVSDSGGKCWLTRDWGFQWKAGGVQGDDVDDNAGELSDWNTFSVDSPAEISESELNSNTTISVREVMKEGYLPFSEGLTDNYSAEFYCANDVKNYDNLEWIQSVQFGETYYCVAFNAPKTTDVEICKINDEEEKLPGWEVALAYKNTNLEFTGITEDNEGEEGHGCITFTNVPYGEYVLSETLQDGWINVSGLGDVIIDGENNEFTIENKERKALTIIAQKIVCEDEIYLPNWGAVKSDGNPITSTTAQAFLNDVNDQAGKEVCWLESGWNFQWANSSTINPGDNIGDGGLDWTTFGPTDSSGQAITTVDDLTGIGDHFWMREMLKPGYIPFSGTTEDPHNDVSAEFYCHVDVLNYDNYDRIDGVELGKEYYCIGFNAPKKSEVTVCKYDDQENSLEGWQVALISEESIDGPHLINVSDGTGTDSTNLPVGYYLIKVNGTYKYGSSEMIADAGYSYRPLGIPDGCDCWFSGFDLTSNSDGLMAWINENPVYWGPYTNTHTYTTTYHHQAEGLVNISIYDNIYHDNLNNGNFSFEIFPIEFQGITKEDGCVTLSNVPYGSYLLDEENRFDWINLSGLGQVIVDDLEETFEIVNTYIENGNDNGNDNGNEVDPYCGNGILDPGEECDGMDGVAEDGSNFCTNTCKLIPVYNGDHECPEGTYPEETPIESINISSENTVGEILNLAAGSYLFKASGQYQYSNNDNHKADAGYGTRDNWSTLRDDLGITEGVLYRGVLSLLSNMGTGVMGIVNWGEWNESHEYQKAYTFGETKNVTFVISDWYNEWYDSSYNNQNAMNDNSGQLNLEVYRCIANENDETGSIEICKYNDNEPYGQKSEEDTILVGWTGRITGPNDYDEDWETTQTGCVTISDLEFGPYTVTEDLSGYWEQMYPSNGGNGSHSINLNDQNPDQSVYFLNYNGVPTTYSCNPSNLQCSLDSSGPFWSLQGCLDACGATSGAGGQYVSTGMVLGEAVTRGEEGIVAGASCVPYLYEYIKYGANNNPFEVKKLQSFLNGYLGLNLDVSGVYDQETYEAVKRFQHMLKYDILSPWVDNGCLPSEDIATGYVYRTTKWAINNMFCPTPRPDVSDEKCYLGDYIGLGDGLDGQILGESVALGEEEVLPEETLLDSTETEEPLDSPEEEELIEEETEESSAQGILVALLAILALGGLAYVVFRGRMA